MDTASLSRLNGLADLGLRGGAEMRPTLLRILTDLYVQKLRHTPEEERHYTELALRLLGAVDVATRMAVASRLAHHLSPPLRVLQYLTDDLPEVAEPLRSHHLLQRPAPAQTAVPQPSAAQVLPTDTESGTQGGDDLFADATSVIDPATASELNELFFTANVDERRLILLNLDVAAPLPLGGIGLARDSSVGERLEAAALARNREDFAQHLVRSLRIARGQARRIVHDHFGEPVVVAARALEVQRDALYRILMFINSAVGHSVERVHALAELYDQITLPAAEGMVAIWQALRQHERAGMRYQPAVWNDAELRTRPAAAGRAAASPAPAKAGTRGA